MPEKACPSATLSTSNPFLAGPLSNSGFQSVNFMSFGISHMPYIDCNCMGYGEKSGRLTITPSS